MATEPRIRATVLTVVTTIQPQNKTFTHTIVIAGGFARSSDEVDRWRLFDLARDRVLFVDDITRTYFSLPVDVAIARRREAASRPLPDGVPPAEAVNTGAKRVIGGVEASELLIRLGGYRRELWIGSPAEVPPNLFSAWTATHPVDSTYGPMMREAGEALLAIRGFPLIDHAELAYGDSRMVVDRTVVRIEKREVPRAWLQVSAGYREVTEPGGNRPPAS